MVSYIAEYVLFGITPALYLVLAAVLISKYRRTQDTGFLWFGIAVILWPLAFHFMDKGAGALLRRSMLGQSLGWYPFSFLVERGDVSLDILVEVFILVTKVVSAGLFLVAALRFHKTKPDSTS
jgi:hypothetical protein